MVRGSGNLFGVLGEVVKLSLFSIDFDEVFYYVH